VRSRQVASTTGRFLFSLVAPQTDCEVLEIGGSRGYSTIWLAAPATRSPPRPTAKSPSHLQLDWEVSPPGSEAASFAKGRSFSASGLGRGRGGLL